MAAYYRQWWLYSSFLSITVTSSLYHATKYEPLLYLDYPACYYLVIVLAVEANAIGYLWASLLGSGICASLFYGGYACNRLIYSEDIVEQNVCHVGMHLIVLISGILTSYLVSKNTLNRNASKPDWKL
jgi:hypothetical protein